jgi:hypothetical protein
MIPTMKDQEKIQAKLEQLKNSQRLLSAKIELWTQKIKAHAYKGIVERSLIQAGGSDWFGPKVDNEVRRYLEAHKSFEDAESGLMQVQVAELQAQFAINQAAIDHLEPPSPKIQSPGGIIRPS